jgi:hypothetical protein
MKFSFTDEKTGEPVALAPLFRRKRPRSDRNEHLHQYFHVHPAAKFTEGSHEAEFYTSFP